jgi:hypothetical protein
MVTHAPQIEFTGERMSVHFDSFGPEAYPLFLRIKSLPEYELSFVPESESYCITAPARFASMLGVDAPERDSYVLPLADYLFDDQAAIVRMALDAKRFAIWSDCGLGKTPMGLELARQVSHLTGGRVLIFTFNEIVPQWIDEAAKFYGDTLPIVRIESRQR